MNSAFWKRKKAVRAHGGGEEEGVLTRGEEVKYLDPKPGAGNERRIRF